MAKFDRFLIAPINTGLQTDLKSWLIPDDAYSQLKNAYVFRGRVRKRFGSRFMGSGWSSAQTEPLFSRLRVNVGTTAAVTGNFGPTVIPVGSTGALWKIGQQFSIGTTIFTVVIANGAMLTTGAATGTFDTATGTLTIVGNNTNPTTAIFWYPSEPVMGLTNYGEGTINNKPSYAFDTRFAYVFTGGSWQRSGSAVTPIWHGDDLDFFWSTNWQGVSPNPSVLFTTNFQVTNYDGAGNANDDPIWYFNGSVWTAALGANGFYFRPTGLAPQAGPFVKTARIIVAFKNRLVLLNTVENDNSGGLGVNTNFINRARWCHYGSPFSVNAWYENNTADTSGNVGDGGGYNDAATEEEIVSVEFIKDRLIVYFERSTWELVYTGNQVIPFAWQKINTELGSESTFSTVPFDREVLTIGNTGVHSCNGSNVQRIDNKIPDEIFEISNKTEGVKRVCGIRDYFVEMVYWTFPSNSGDPTDTFTNRILVYNYKNGSWAFNDDCINTFGYYEQQTGTTWSSTSFKWNESNFIWDSATIAAQFRQVIAGNQQGYTFIIDSSESNNARAMQITNLTYPDAAHIQLVLIDHVLSVDDYISIENISGATINDEIYYRVSSVVNDDTVIVEDPDNTITGVYSGGGNSARVSRIDIVSKQWNPYVDQDRNASLAKIDFSVTRTQDGEITIDYAPSAAEISILNDSGPTGTNARMGNGILETRPYSPGTLEDQQERLWHPIYFQVDGTCVQIRIYLSNEQMSDVEIADSQFELQGLVLYFMPTTNRIQ